MASTGQILGVGALNAISGFRKRRQLQQTAQGAAQLFALHGGEAGKQFAQILQQDPQQAVNVLRAFGIPGVVPFFDRLQQQEQDRLAQEQQGVVNQRADERIGLERRRVENLERTTRASAQESLLQQGNQETLGRLILKGADARTIFGFAAATGQDVDASDLQGAGIIKTPAGTPFAKISAKDFTPSSLQAFAQSNDFSDLVPVDQDANDPVANIIRNGTLTSARESTIQPGDIRVSSQSIPVERADLPGVTTTTQTGLEERFISLDSLEGGISSMLTRLAEPGAVSAIGIRGALGELFVDGLAAQINPNLVNEQRVEIREEARSLVQQNLRNISDDQRFTEAEREEVRKILVSLRAVESLPQAQTKLRRFREIVRDTRKRSLGAINRLNAERDALNITPENIRNQSTEALEARRRQLLGQ